jgi:hypothetical protein
MRAVTSVSVSTRGHAHMRGSEPQDGLFGGSGTAGLKIERGPVGAAHRTVADSLLTLPSPGSVIINGRSWLSSSLNGALAPGARSEVNVEHAQRSEHERR